MGQPVARFGDLSCGHYCFPPRATVEASRDVFVEHRGAHRKGDSWSPHACPHSGAHTGITIGGSSTVFINDKGCGYVGSSISCGDYILTGASTVFVGT